MSQEHPSQRPRSASARRKPGRRRRRASPEAQIARLLTWLLRHQPEEAGLSLDPQGWVSLAALLEGLEGFTASGRLGFAVDRGLIEKAVAGDVVNRFELDGEGGRLRARTGHSVELMPAAAGDDAAGDDAAGDDAAGDDAAGDDAARSVASSAASLPLTPADVPRYLFAGAGLHDLARRLAAGGLEGRADGEQVELTPHSQQAREQAERFAAEADEPCLVVVEAGRAVRSGRVKFQRGDGDSVVTPRVPREFVFNSRPGWREQHSAGGVVVRQGQAGREVLLIAIQKRGFTGARRRPRRRWELPKGKIDPGEQAVDAAVREVREETGLQAEMEVGPFLGTVHYHFRLPRGTPIFKSVHFWLIHCPGGDQETLVPALDEDVVAVEWVAISEVMKRAAHVSLRPVLSAVCRHLGEEFQEDA